MSETLTIEGISYVSASQAGKHFGYTKDYLSMLIHRGKIEGHKVGRKWYVNLSSAESYFKTAHEQRTAYRKHISTERKKELHHHMQTRTVHRPHTALVETLVILILGLSVGVTGYLGTVKAQPASLMQSDFSFFKNIAVALYTLVTPHETAVVSLPSQAPVQTSVQIPAQEKTNAQQALVHTATQSTTTSALVVIPPSYASDTNTIAQSFSDEVTVVHDPNNQNTGIITPIFKNTKGEPYRFLMVPVMQEANN